LVPAKACEVCKERSAFYICQECGKAVCPVCWRGIVCMECAERNPDLQVPEDPFSFPQGLLFRAATIIIFAGIILVILGLSTGGGTGGCFVWPFPLIIGCGFGSGGNIGFYLFLFGLLAFAPLLFWWSLRRLRGTL